jgi:hypothetical protein
MAPPPGESRPAPKSIPSGSGFCLAPRGLYEIFSSAPRGHDWASSLELQPDGKLLVAGSIYEDEVVARFKR